MCNKKKQGYPPLGILYIAAYIRHYFPSCLVDVFDVFPSKETILNGSYDVVGFSAMSIQFPDACEYAEDLRRDYSDIIVVGGVHTSLTHTIPEWADYGIVGEGELTFFNLIKWLSDDHRGRFSVPEHIEGLIIRNNGMICETRTSMQIKDLDTIPIPAWDLIDMDPYLRDNNVYGTVIGRGLSLLTTRGCCYRCEFCAAQQMWGNVRFHSAEYVADMIQHVIKHYGVKHIWMADDHFALNKERLRRLSYLLRQRNLNIGIGVSCRIESYDEEMCELLHSLNVKALALGLETGSDRMLKHIKNGCKLTVEQERRIVEKMDRDGFQVHGMFMINMPGETIEDLEMTVRFIHSLPLSKLSVAVATPYFGTKWWQIALDQRIVPQEINSYDFLRTYNMKSLSPERPIFKTEIPRDTLSKTYESLMQYSKSLFYFNWEDR